MKREVFDVLIVYSARQATSAGELNSQSVAPFAEGSACENYNDVYGYFLNICEKNGLKAAFTTSADIVGAGTCRSFWRYTHKRWIKVLKSGYSQVIFDKFSPINKKIRSNRRLLFSSAKVKPFNHPAIYDLFFDKQKSYAKLHRFSIPTVTINAISEVSVSNACTALAGLMKKHPFREDFTAEVIVKDRFGAGGRRVYKYEIHQIKQIAAMLRRHSRRSFIIQPFVRFDTGFSFNNKPVSTDIRLIYFGEKIIQTYIRMAKAGDYRCNEHLGGRLKYISKLQVPRPVIQASKKISSMLHTMSSLYALDFIISNNGNTYFLEGNTGPGLDWNESLDENRMESQKLIRIIVKELLTRARPIALARQRTVTTDKMRPMIFGEPLVSVGELALV